MVDYKGIKISKNSYAYELLDQKKFKELDQHLIQLENKRLKLEGK